MVEQLLKQLFREVLREELQSLREELRAPAPQPEQIYLNTNEAAALLGLHPETVRGMVKSGRLPRREVAGNLRFTRSDLDGLLGTHEPGPEISDMLREAVTHGTSDGYHQTRQQAVRHRRG